MAPGLLATALCGGIPLAASGARVRAVQSSQNPGDAPGFGRATVGETPRDSRIRACRRMPSPLGAKKDSRPLRFVSKGVGPSALPLARSLHAGKRANRAAIVNQAASGA